METVVKTTPSSLFNAATEHNGQAFARRRHPYRNQAYAPLFVANGAAKRRQLAYQRATLLQREMGVATGLHCVK